MEIIFEIKKKIKENRVITLKEQEFVKKLENSQIQRQLLKKQIQASSESISNTPLKQRNLLNINKISTQWKKNNETGSSSSKSTLNMNNSYPKKDSVVQPKSQISIFGNFKEIKTGKFKNDIIANDLREKVTSGNERLKEQIQNEMSFSEKVYKNIKFHVPEMKREKIPIKYNNLIKLKSLF